MSEQNQTEQRVQEPWEKLVEVEALKFVEAVEANFMHGLQVSLPHLPDGRNPEQRGRQLDYFISAMIGATVRNIVKTANSGTEIEEFVVTELRRKFAYVREYQQNALKEAKETKTAKPISLLGPDGKPVGRG